MLVLERAAFDDQLIAAVNIGGEVKGDLSGPGCAAGSDD
jgi:hypothetical protein